MDAKKSYQDFWDAVKENLKKNLSCWKLGDDDVEQFMRSEENEIKGGYDRYRTGYLANGRTDEACFKSAVSTVAMCLEYCY